MFGKLEIIYLDIYISRERETRWSCLTARLNDLAITIPKHNVHIMDKNFLTSEAFEEFVEEILDV